MEPARLGALLVAAPGPQRDHDDLVTGARVCSSNRCDRLVEWARIHALEPTLIMIDGRAAPRTVGATIGRTHTRPDRRTRTLNGGALMAPLGQFVRITLYE